MTFHLITTLDYELFGDGSGCLNNCLLRPTDSFLQVCERAGAPAVLFVETLEFRAMFEQRERKEVPTSKYYESVAQQLGNCAENGHELQLHLHPQWSMANWKADKWVLDFSRWRVGDLSKEQTVECIDDGVGWLQSVLQQNSADWLEKHSMKTVCNVFRAGGWTLQPAGPVCQALQSRGVLVDSTVAPGQKNSASGDWYDFSHNPDKPYWFFDKDVLIESDNGTMLEVPILTAEVGAKAHAKALKENKSQPAFPEGCFGTYAGPNSRWQSLKAKVGKVLNMGRVMLDFSTMPSWMLIEITQRYMERFQNFPEPVPLVAIGHNKNFTNWSRDNFAEYLAWASSQSEIKFSSYNQWLDELKLSSADPRLTHIADAVA